MQRYQNMQRYAIASKCICLDAQNYFINILVRLLLFSFLIRLFIFFYFKCENQAIKTDRPTLIACLYVNSLVFCY